MKTWYKAVCDTHNVACVVMVNNPITSKHYLEEHNEAIHRWLEEHYGCELRLVWRDDQLDKLWETVSYENAHQEKLHGKKRKTIGPEDKVTLLDILDGAVLLPPEKPTKVTKKPAKRKAR